MKLQMLTESMKAGLDKQSTLSSEVAKSEKLVEKLRKEIEVNVCNNFSMRVYITSYVRNYVHAVLCEHT